jgi:hypothetical protein
MENMNEGKGRDDSWHGRAIFFLGGECHFILYQLSTLYLFIFLKKLCCRFGAANKTTREMISTYFCFQDEPPLL